MGEQKGKGGRVTVIPTPKIVIDPETYAVTADGDLLVCESAETLPMAQRYFLF